MYDQYGVGVSDILIYKNRGQDIKRGHLVTVLAWTSELKMLTVSC